MDQESVAALQALGFTELEAAIYTFLLQESPATGYRVAQAIGKATANTYKAISSLESKGAILVDEGGSRLCRAVPPEELLSQMDRRFQDQRRRAEEALSHLEQAPDDERVYHLRTRDQVLERARQMLGRARQAAVLSLSPLLVEALRPALEAAAARGVAVLLKGYLPVDVPGVHVAVSTRFESVPELLPGDELSLSVDALELLTAMLSRAGDAALQAIWSSSPFLAFNHYNGLYCEWMLTALADHFDPDSLPDPMGSAMKARPQPLETPGFRRLAGAEDGQPADHRLHPPAFGVAG